MLSENIKAMRNTKGLSQEQLANELNVVRQTVSKWEKGLSVPDAGMLIRIAEALDCTVNMLLGETVPEPEEKSEIKMIAEMLEEINNKLADQSERRRKAWQRIYVIVGIAAILLFIRCIIVWIYTLHIQNSMSHSTGIIGGADGPTSIFFTARVPDVSGYLVAMILLIISGTGLYKTKKK